MYHLALKIGTLGLFLLICGCLRVGLPEHIASIPASAAPQPINTILINPSLENVNRSIGNQFVALIFPLSRIYLEHGYRRLASEIIAEEFSAKGLVVVETDEIQAALKLYRSIPTVTRIIMLRRAEASASVLDLFFSRRIIVDGILEVALIAPEAGDTIAKDIIPISSGEFRSTAFGPAITSLLERGTRKAVDEMTVLGLEPPRRRSESTPRIVPSCVVPPPSLPSPFPTALGEAASLSYGFKRTGAFQPPQLARLIQRGAVRGLSRLGISCGFTSGDEANFSGDADRLVLKFDKIELSPDWAGISSKVRSNASGSAVAVEVPLRTDVDGSVAWALEELGERAIAALGLGLTSK